VARALVPAFCYPLTVLGGGGNKNESLYACLDACKHVSKDMEPCNTKKLGENLALPEISGSRTDGEETYARLVTNGHSPRLIRRKKDLIWDSIWSSQYPSTSDTIFEPMCQSFAVAHGLRWSPRPKLATPQSEGPRSRSANGRWRRRRFRVPCDDDDDDDKDINNNGSHLKPKRVFGVISMVSKAKASFTETRKLSVTPQMKRILPMRLFPSQLPKTMVAAPKLSHASRDTEVLKKRNPLLCELAKSCRKSIESTKSGLSKSTTGDARDSTLNSTDSNPVAAPPKEHVPNSFRITRRTWSAALMWKMSNQFNIELNTVRELWQLFLTYGDADEGFIEPNGFQMVLNRLLKENYEKLRDIPHDLFSCQNVGTGEVIDFISMLEWYSAHAFKEWFVIKGSQVNIRALARKYSVSLLDTERIEKEFKAIDTNCDGLIGFTDFCAMMIKKFDVNDTGMLSSKRLAMLWLQIDAKQKGHVDFTGYFDWYASAFGLGAGVSENKY